MLRFVTVRPAARGLALITICCTIAVVVGVILVNRGPLPTILANKGIALLEKQYPVHVHIGAAKFTGPLRLAFRDVTIELPENSGLTRPLKAEQVQLDFNPMAVLRGRHMAGLERVHVINPEIQADYQRYLQLVQPEAKRPATKQKRPAVKRDPDTQTTLVDWSTWPQIAIFVRDGLLKLNGQGAPGPVYFDVAAYAESTKFQVTRLAVRKGGGQVTANGVLQQNESINAQLDVSGWSTADLLSWYPTLPVYGLGTVSAKVKVGGKLRQPALAGQIGLHDAQLSLPAAEPKQKVAIRQASVKFENAGEALKITSLDLTTPTGQLTGRGIVSIKNINVQLSARSLTLPDDIPLVAAWGIAGKASFAGKLGGTLAQPLLQGDLTLHNGRLWNQPVDKVQGKLRLSSDEFTFDSANIEKGRSRYILSGELTDLGRPQQALQVNLNSRDGRVEDLLAVLALPIDANGRLDGVLTFGGPFTNIVTAGKVTVRDVRLYGEQLDYVQGSFRWGEGQLALDNIKGRLGEGSLQVAGHAALDGSALKFDVDIDRWPLEKIARLNTLAPRRQGELSWTGMLSGSAAHPELDGALLARNLQLEKARVERLAGPLVLSDGHLETTGLVATTPEGGEWRLYGRVSNVLTEPDFGLNLVVEDQSLSSLLAMGGYRIPAAIVDGAVHGTVSLDGPVDDPEALLELNLSERGLTHESLSLDLRIADKRVSILHIGA